MAMTDKLIARRAAPILTVMHDFILHEIHVLRTTAARSKVYRRTASELYGLSDRELADIGIPRCMIRQVAREEAMKVSLS